MIEEWLVGKEVPGKVILDDANASRLFSSYPELEFMLEASRTDFKSGQYISSEDDDVRKVKKTADRIIDFMFSPV